MGLPWGYQLPLASDETRRREDGEGEQGKAAGFGSCKVTGDRKALSRRRTDETVVAVDVTRIESIDAKLDRGSQILQRTGGTQIEASRRLSRRRSRIREQVRREAVTAGTNAETLGTVVITNIRESQRRQV